MKILIVNTSDIEGGAARAAFRLYRSLETVGVDASMLVQKKSGHDHGVAGERSIFEKGLAQMRPVLDALPLRRYKNKRPTYFSPSWLPFSGAVKRINASDADIVHLHWIARGFLRPEDIAAINKPVVWSLHDNWAFTGGCHLMWDCEKYQTHCGACPVLGSKEVHDLSYRQFEKKLKYFPRSKIKRVIGLSHWLADCAKSSRVFNGFEVRCLPNPIDTRVYSPVDQGVGRGLLRLPTQKKIITFGAIGGINDVNKGFDKLADALSLLRGDDIELVVFGADKAQSPLDFGFPVHYLGHLHDELSLRVLYSAADVMVVPSLQENLSNAIMESLSCGTPVVAFDTGGNGDLVSHMQNGYLAHRLDAQDLARGITWVLNHPTVSELKKYARLSVMHFDSQTVAGMYKKLYEDVLNDE